jgi:hypothetical protein
LQLELGAGRRRRTRAPVLQSVAPSASATCRARAVRREVFAGLWTLAPRPGRQTDPFCAMHHDTCCSHAPCRRCKPATPLATPAGLERELEWPLVASSQALSSIRSHKPSTAWPQLCSSVCSVHHSHAPTNYLVNASPSNSRPSSMSLPVT